jgi:site-specific DNA-adenine methylase
VTRLAPFWRYYGGKFRSAPRYPKPTHSTIVEPFAGAAGYSMRYADRKVVLVEKYPVISGVWRYLISVSEGEILSIPEVDDVRDLPPWVPQEARWLVGFCMNDGVTSPCVRLSAGRIELRNKGRAYEGWCHNRKELIAKQLRLIRHWTIIDGDFSAAPAVAGTWFVDPPYRVAGKYYKHTLSAGDYTRLASWCRDREGQVIVCENDGADWLPFEPFAKIKSGPAKRASAEAIWHRR